MVAVEVSSAPFRPALRDRLRPYLFSAPSILITIGIVYPFLLAVYLTLTNYSALHPNPRFLGFLNYQLLLSSGTFWASLAVTFQYAVGATTVELVLGLAVALLLNRDTLVTRLLRFALIVPLAIAPVIATLIWKLMMQPSVGILDYLLSPFGLGHMAWAGSARTALLSVLIVDVWIYTPFSALILLSGLRSLPREPYEAAQVDGASSWFTFRTLTLPLMLPFIVVVVLFRFMDSLKIFDIIYAMTGGGPGDTLMTLQLQAYYNSILYTNFSGGLTYMVILWVIVFAISQLLVRFYGRVQQRAAGVEP